MYKGKGGKYVKNFGKGGTNFSFVCKLQNYCQNNGWNNEKGYAQSCFGWSNWLHSYLKHQYWKYSNFFGGPILPA